jgi:hypothetical protein
MPTSPVAALARPVVRRQRREHDARRVLGQIRERTDQARDGVRTERCEVVRIQFGPLQCSGDVGPYHGCIVALLVGDQPARTLAL